MLIDDMDDAARADLLGRLETDYEALAQQALNLDLTRGKPGPEQLALSDGLDGILAGNYRDDDGVDVRNYGGLTGIREARELFAAVLGCPADRVLLGGNSSLQLMHLVVEYALHHGLKGTPWREQGPVKFLCPVPGYDRHFALCEHLGIGLRPVPLTGEGPDMDVVEQLVKEDPSVRGLWCVPRFSNPTGETYSADTVRRIAKLPRLAASDFVVMWDNAYAVHALDDDAPTLVDIQPLLAEAGTEDNLFQFASTSKITFAGAGIACLASSTRNIGALTEHLSFATIGPDKVNELRHVRLLRDLDGVHEHMRQHAALIRPRFEAVQAHLSALDGTGMGEWTRPRGGYFVSFNTRPGLARTVVALAADIGLKLTPAGATWPHGDDPADSNIRLAPTFASLEDVNRAMAAFVTCVKLASLRQLAG